MEAAEVGTLAWMAEALVVESPVEACAAVVACMGVYGESGVCEERG